MAKKRTQKAAFPFPQMHVSISQGGLLKYTGKIANAKSANSELFAALCFKNNLLNHQEL